MPLNKRLNFVPHVHHTEPREEFPAKSIKSDYQFQVPDVFALRLVPVLPQLLW